MDLHTFQWPSVGPVWVGRWCAGSVLEQSTATVAATTPLAVICHWQGEKVDGFFLLAPLVLGQAILNMRIPPASTDTIMIDQDPVQDRLGAGTLVPG
jgi:hypothetical protein